jgi:hypothetical protein
VLAASSMIARLFTEGDVGLSKHPYCYEDDGHLVHTDKRTGAQKISLKAWPDLAGAKQAMAAGLGKIEWEELNEPPPAA